VKKHRDKELSVFNERWLAGDSYASTASTKLCCKIFSAVIFYQSIGCNFLESLQLRTETMMAGETYKDLISFQLHASTVFFVFLNSLSGFQYWKTTKYYKQRIFSIIAWTQLY
jgi:hypothetical protein